MPNDSTASAEQEKPPDQGLATHASRGMVWMLLQTVGTRGVNLLGQIALSWLLTPADFALYALANGFTSFGQQCGTFGVDKVLIQRAKHIDNWSVDGFWFAASTGAIATAILVVIAPWLGHIYQSQTLVWMIWLIAPTTLLGALTAVPKATMSVRLQFRLGAIFLFLPQVSQMCLIVLLAALDFGAFSFAIPQPIIALGLLIFLWIVVRPPLRRSAQWGKWPRLIKDSAKITAAAVLSQISFQGDYLLLGYFHSDDKSVVGVYFFAFMLSSQIINLLTNNVAGVLYPILSRLNDQRERQYRAYVRASSALAAVGIPMAFLQAALAAPAIHLIFAPKWYSAIPILQVLSMAMGIRVVGNTSQIFLGAQGRFTARLIFDIVWVGTFLPLVALGAIFGQGTLVATAVLVNYAIIYLPGMAWILSTSGGQARDLWRILGTPTMAGAGAVGAAYGLCQWLLPQQYGSVQLVIVPIVSAAIYLPLIRWFAPEPYAELMEMSRKVLRRIGIKRAK